MAGGTIERDTTSRWRWGRPAAAVAAIVALFVGLIGGAVPAQAADPGYQLVMTGPSSGDTVAWKGFAYNAVLTVPGAVSDGPATGLELTVTLDAGLTIDQVDTSAESPVESVAKGAGNTWVLHLRDISTNVTEFSFTVKPVGAPEELSANTVYTSTIKGNSPGSLVAPEPSSASTKVTGTLDYFVATWASTVNGSDHRDVTYTYRIGSGAPTADTNFYAHNVVFTDILPAGATVVAHSEPGFMDGAWTLTPLQDGTTKAEYRLSSPVRNVVNSEPASLWLRVSYPSPTFPVGYAPKNTVTLDLTDATGNKMPTRSASATSDAIAEGKPGATETTMWGMSTTQNGAVNQSHMFGGSFVGDSQEGLRELSVETAADASAADTQYWDHNQFMSVAVKPSANLYRLNLPMVFWYKTGKNPQWRQLEVDQNWTSAQPTWMFSVIGTHQGQPTADNAHLTMTIPVEQGDWVSGFKVAVRADGATTVPPTSELSFDQAIRPAFDSISTGDRPSGDRSGPYTQSVRTVGIPADGGAELPSEASRAQTITDALPLTGWLKVPSGLRVGGSADFEVSIANFDSGGRTYKDGLLELVLPVGVFYDAGRGVKAIDPEVGISGQKVPTLGNGLSASTKTVKDSDGTHQVLTLRVAELSSLSRRGNSLVQSQNDHQMFSYSVPVKVSLGADQYIGEPAPASLWVHTEDPSYAGLTEYAYGWATSEDEYGFQNARPKVPGIKDTLSVLAANTLSVQKLVSTGQGQWGTSTQTGRNTKNTWQLAVVNGLSNEVTDAVLFDRLPYKGDANGSEFALTLAGPVTGAPAGTTVEYSKDATAADNGTWSSNPDGATAVRARLGSMAARSDVTLSFETISADTSDVARGRKAVNTAQLSGSYQGVSDVYSTDAVSLVAAATPSISVVKKTNGKEIASADDAETVSAGSTVTWSYEVTNDGDLPLSDVKLSDAFTVGDSSGTMTPTSPDSGTLAPGAKRTFTATSTAIAGTYHNTVTATGTPTDGTSAVTARDESWYKATAPGQLRLSKTADAAAYDAIGDKVTYTFTVENTGGAAVNGIAIDERSFSGSGTLGTLDCGGVTSIAVGGDPITCTASYTLTPADFDRGTVTNTAVATGTDAYGAAVTSNQASATVTTRQAAALRLTKSAGPTTVKAAGDTVTYRFGVVNSGNVTVDDLRITEKSFTGTGEIRDLTCPTTSLAVGASTECTASYAVTQADLDRGSINNTATASGRDVNGGSVTSNESSATVGVTASPALALQKTADRTTISAAGDRVGYSFEVKNTGNLSLSGVSVAETAFSGTGTQPTVRCAPGRLAPGASVTCTATYSVTQADLETPLLKNTARASALTPAAVAVNSNTSTVEIPSTQTPNLLLTKSASTNGGTLTAKDQTVNYTFKVENIGNVRVTDISVAETAFSGTGAKPSISCPATELAVGAPAIECTATYSATQADLDAGQLRNSARATGKGPQGADVPSNVSSATVTATQTSRLELTKASTTDRINRAGQAIDYSFTVRNGGNTTISALRIVEQEFSGSARMGAVTCPSTSLAPGAQTVCTAAYVTTQADLESSRLKNVAIAQGTAPNGTGVPSAPSEVNIDAVHQQGLEVVKTSNAETINRAGQRVTYTYAVKNTGNVPMTGIKVNEDFNGTGALRAPTCGTTTLAPYGGTTSCTTTYTVTEKDLELGTLKNSATVTGTGPDGETTSPPSGVETPTELDPALSVAKTADRETVTKAGDKVKYSFAVTNTGNVTLKDIKVNEVEFGGSGKLPAPTCRLAELGPGATTECTTTYTVTQADMETLSLRNIATVSGTGPDGEVTSPPSEADVPTVRTQGLSLVKTSDAERITVAGQKVTYTFKVTNTGNVTLKDIKVNEGDFSGSGTLPAPTCASSTLAPGQSLECTSVYTVTKEDLEHGSLKNTATATGTGPDGPVTSPGSGVDVETTPQAGGLSLVKTADAERITFTGQKVLYTFTVKNTGTLAVDGVAINEGEFSGRGELDTPVCRALSLEPGASTTCTVEYTVEKQDLGSSSLVNTATAGGLTVNGPVSSNGSRVAVPVKPGKGGLSLVKTADNAELTHAGQIVTYSFTITNTGNGTVRNVRIQEGVFTGTGPLPDPTCPSTTLVGGQRMVCTTQYTVTAEDLEAGSLMNTASVVGDTEDGRITAPSSTATVTTTTTTTLVETGADVSPLLIGSIGVLVLLGTALVLGARRRRGEAESAE